ncbi:myelin-oligodendrocyte glycoprotein-like [Poeciliopsis prolifica]|uniref:myelin-oligodendrocyte glycoprotein-like n=1 Tax=Poeciliopsis prolifica TaxID=188132 RepID=UPI002414116C|nr:myelin-oligodendrocyte glycoprotein-like [Poeciliopsis prolifica]
MDEDPLRTGDLSLTLLWPIFKDEGIYTCSVLRDGDMLMEKRVLLWVKVPKVEVESGVESVLLPWRITERLDGGVKVEWKDEDNKKVHVYQNGSDQPGEQDQKYRTRTKMDGNALKNKNLSLTLTCPTFRDTGTYTCSVYNRDGDMLMRKQVSLQVKGQWFKCIFPIS